MKKGMALETIIVLILAIISLAIGIYMVVKAGLLSNLQTVICTSITTWTMLVRGIIVHVLTWAFGALIGLFTLYIFITGKFCRATLVGAAYCAALIAAFSAILFASILGVFSGLPMIDCPNPAIMIGDFNKGIGDSLASNQTFLKQLADRTVDCWKMYAKGKYDPLIGKTPPNPRTCFVFNFNLKQGITPQEMLDYMENYRYPDGKKCSSLPAGTPCHTYKEEMQTSNNTDIIRLINIMRTDDYVYYKDYDWINEIEEDEIYMALKLQKGRVFIKFYDDFFWKHHIRDADCWTGGKIEHDRVFWCFDDQVTCADNKKLANDSTIDCPNNPISGQAVQVT